MLNILVIDGQGGGIGKAVIERLKNTFGETIHLTAVGTNALATAQMLKAGANDGASGESAVIYNCKKADIIIGSVSILVTDAFLGELTCKMAEAISQSNATKLLIPLNRNKIEIAGNALKPLPHYIDDVLEFIQCKTGEKHV